jgi:hypothetical protein
MFIFFKFITNYLDKYTLYKYIFIYLYIYIYIYIYIYSIKEQYYV